MHYGSTVAHHNLVCQYQSTHTYIHTYVHGLAVVHRGVEVYHAGILIPHCGTNLVHNIVLELYHTALWYV
jgi:hypothetical protein